jgi:endo-1,4-beta-xylanase
MAFKAAAEAVAENNLSAKLYYNDYNISYAGPKATAVQNLVKDLQSRDIQIDGVGLEAHFALDQTPLADAQEQNMRALTDPKIDIPVTELDVRVNLPPSAADELQQAKDYYSSVAACTRVERYVGVTVWDFVDTYGWVGSVFPNTGYADLFLQEGGAGTPLVKKLPYDACLRALTGQP